MSRGRRAAMCCAAPPTHTNTSLFTAPEFETLHVVVSPPCLSVQVVRADPGGAPGSGQHARLGAFGVGGSPSTLPSSAEPSCVAKLPLTTS